MPVKGWFPKSDLLNWPEEKRVAEVDRERKRVAEVCHCVLWQQQRVDFRVEMDRFLTFIVRLQSSILETAIAKSKNVQYNEGEGEV